MSSLPGVLAHQLIIPVVVIDDAGAASDLAAAIAAGGIGCVEITLRTPAGLAAIAAMAETGEVVVGAGTVLDTGDVDRVAAAGARFVVTPGFDDDVVARCLELGLAVLPGIATATELQRARRVGLQAVKFFPADRLGGVATISALAAPFAGIGFVPSGGVSPANLAEYLAHPAVPAVSGSWIVSRDLIRAGRFADVERLSRVAIASARSARP
jgi:2-dehydro-3-deoxyphosphogluconate aldolase/(4S)-4-hydroxy-2-oxoglutarate aldolase